MQRSGGATGEIVAGSAVAGGLPTDSGYTDAFLVSRRLVARLTHQGTREWVFQLEAREAFLAVVEAWKGECPDYHPVRLREHEGWFALGFADQSHMTRAFVRQFGFTVASVVTFGAEPDVTPVLRPAASASSSFSSSSRLFRSINARMSVGIGGGLAHCGHAPLAAAGAARSDHPDHVYDHEAAACAGRSRRCHWCRR